MATADGGTARETYQEPPHGAQHVVLDGPGDGPGHGHGSRPELAEHGTTSQAAGAADDEEART